MDIPGFRTPDPNSTPSDHDTIINGHLLAIGSCDNLTTFRPDWTGYQLYRVILDVAIVGLICLLGFVGNAMTIVILWSDQDKRSPTNWLLQTLAVVDIVYLVACVFIQPLKTVNDLTAWFGPELKGALMAMEAHYIWAFASVTQVKKN